MKDKIIAIVLAVLIIFSIFFVSKIFSQDSLRISQLRKSFFKALSEPQEGVNLRVSWDNMNYDAGVTLNLYQLLANDEILLKQEINPSYYKGLDFVAQWDTDSLYSFFMTAVKDGRETLPSDIATWEMEEFELYPPEINVYRPYISVTFEQYHKWRKFNITINNQTGNNIDSLIIRLDNCVFDWLVYNDKEFFIKENTDGENEGKVGNEIFLNIKKDEKIVINCDLDKSAEVHAFVEDVEGRVIVSGLEAKLKKEEGKEIYKTEIKF